MANFIAIVDGDTERRRRFLRRVRTEIAPVDSLRVSEIEVGDLAAVWAAQERAPVSCTSSPVVAAVIWGDAIPGPGPERLDASGLVRTWARRGSAPVPAFDGFFAALRYDPSEGLTVGADLLGLFPVYYAARGGALVVGSSPELFRHHPWFPAELSRAGLTGLLLTHALLDGRALLSGVRRLGPGHVLTWRAGTEPLEVLQYAIPVSSRVNGGSFQADVDQLHGVLAGAIDRHMPPERTPGMLLSGGRDSRLLAGYLRKRGDRIHALTLGSATDYEVSCAKAVARVLGCTHRVTPLDDAQLPTGARLQVRWEHMASGFSNIHMWGAVAPLRDLPAHFVSGYLRDVRERDAMPTAFDTLLRGADHHGIGAAALRRLLRPDVFDEPIERMERRLREVYEASAAIEDERPWRFLFAHGWRSHAGGVPWKLSFGSWPVLPILDRQVLQVIAALPDSTLLHRRAQDAILCHHFPELARLPLDRNSHDTLPLLPSLGQRIRYQIGRMGDPIRPRIHRTIERRHYHRVYDINGPGWRAVRRLAEPHRERLADLVVMDVLAELVPPPDAHIAVEHRIRDSFGTKLLLGLMLWSADHLS